MNFVRPATQKAVSTICKLQIIHFINQQHFLTEEQQTNFDLENKVRNIVADMLLNMNDKLGNTDKSVRLCQNDLVS